MLGLSMEDSKLNGIPQPFSCMPAVRTAASGLGSSLHRITHPFGRAVPEQGCLSKPAVADKPQRIAGRCINGEIVPAMRCHGGCEWHAATII